MICQVFEYYKKNRHRSKITPEQTRLLYIYNMRLLGGTRHGIGLRQPAIHIYFTQLIHICMRIAAR